MVFVCSISVDVCWVIQAKRLQTLLFDPLPFHLASLTSLLSSGCHSRSRLYAVQQSCNVSLPFSRRSWCDMKLIMPLISAVNFFKVNSRTTVTLYDNPRFYCVVFLYPEINCGQRQLHSSENNLQIIFFFHCESQIKFILNINKIATFHKKKKCPHF